MKKLQAMILAVVLSVCFVTGATAKEVKAKKTQKPSAVVVDVASWTATVKEIDYVNKTAVLDDEKGRKVKVNAKNARNLDQVLVGDKVKIDYVQEMAISVRKADSTPIAGSARAVKLTPKGKMPGGVITETVQIQANVEDINYANRTITLKDPSGESHTYKVSKQVERLKEVKKGDQVVIDVTQALALEVIKK